MFSLLFLIIVQTTNITLKESIIHLESNFNSINTIVLSKQDIKDLTVNQSFQNFYINIVAIKNGTINDSVSQLYTDSLEFLGIIFCISAANSRNDVFEIDAMKSLIEESYLKAHRKVEKSIGDVKSLNLLEIITLSAINLNIDLAIDLQSKIDNEFRKICTEILNVKKLTEFVISNKPDQKNIDTFFEIFSAQHSILESSWGISNFFKQKIADSKDPTEVCTLTFLIIKLDSISLQTLNNFYSVKMSNSMLKLCEDICHNFQIEFFKFKNQRYELFSNYEADFYSKIKDLIRLRRLISRWYGFFNVFIRINILLLKKHLHNKFNTIKYLLFKNGYEFHSVWTNKFSIFKYYCVFAPHNDVSSQIFELYNSCTGPYYKVTNLTFDNKMYFMKGEDWNIFKINMEKYINKLVSQERDTNGYLWTLFFIFIISLLFYFKITKKDVN